MSEDDIIAAIATAPGAGGIGVVRVSGPRLEALIGGILGRPMPPRHAVLAQFLDRQGTALDEGIAIYFPAPQSYTGQDVLELQGHGGPVVLQLLLRRTLELGARLAEPGEFTQRAYLNDKLDLAQAEAVADLINATTAEAARGAMQSLQGAFSLRIGELVETLIELRVQVEAALDFPDEDVELLRQLEVKERTVRLRRALEELLAVSQQGSLLRQGIQVVLAGPPNVGKSSLLNQLAGEELAIVTDVPGTTRDVIRQSISLEGVPAHIIDTAGLRESGDPVERVGIERTWAAIAKADLVLLLLDATNPQPQSEDAILKQLPATLPCIRVMNKIDLLRGAEKGARREGSNKVWLSAKTGAGIGELRSLVLEAVGWRGGDALFLARERHLQALVEARMHLEAAGLQGGANRLELMAEELRRAQAALNFITGEFTPDDLLGQIFSRFCLGK